ncbi:DegV family protein [Aneurinibacillus aneurinilyticus]|uniref:EDD domain protein, DegV family n=1 Tax=Aneurinibacillus aneurinilyticus ATCC 12856 TaxID=649747 RepID=U1WKN2_ANEAE|nr:DegV family protein [Aneurinibacillus aneurinilyticus]ERI09154.1 EDD domain protein, DegV family [Aneurinibacillus aneurinilyticus ATCC 12856]MED0707487.1 DegV family protein [Aneurinibacillus aneurinilyticus]MED0724705.1 DegV family protein [Aneurinibacillus aneurinilyticus]MED0733155.1 DegV family protein [Aneurinibacillus aneurinilyticus]MED0742868.1 DegV family protein [Aneurinibacillus aneurinilyticus]
MKLYIVTDSTADIPKELAAELDIHIVPLKVHIGDMTYLDGVTLSTGEFYEKLAQADKLPRTSQPSPADFVDVYESLAAREEDGEVISIHLSSALSGTYQTANLAKDMVREKINVHAIDSRTASYALGAIVVAVARAARVGNGLQYCLDLTQRLIANHKAFFVMDTLMYLQKGGRIGKASAVLGSLLNVKPILTFDEAGEVAAVEKVRGKKKAVGRIVDLINEYAAGEPVVASVVHATSHEEAEALKVRVAETLNITEDIVVTELGPVIGTYGGPGLLAVMLYKV